MSLSYTGSRVCRSCLKSLTRSRSCARFSTATMSVRGIITSRTVLSPISMMPWIIWCSCSSITPCSSETCRTVSSSSSVRYGARDPRPPVMPREMIVTAQRIGLKKVAIRSTGPAAASATRSALAIASVLGVTSAAIRMTIDKKNDTSSVSHSRHVSGTPARVSIESVISAVAVEATIRANVFVNKTVDRNRFGSERRRCRIAAAGLPCSARKRTRNRPTDVSAVSVPLARAATTKHTSSVISSISSWPFIERGLSEELADAPVLVHPDDRLSEQRRHRQDRQRRAQLLRWDGDGVGHDHFFNVGLSESFHGVAGQYRMGRGQEHFIRALLAQGGREVGDGAARGDDVLDDHAVAAFHIT